MVTIYYGSTRLATNFTNKEMNDWRVRILYFLLFFIPRANPDNEKMYPLVKKWLLEIDGEGIPIREIALDEKGKAIFSSPDERNYGFWTDSNQTFSQTDIEPIDKEYFDQLWKQLNSTEKKEKGAVPKKG